MFRNSRIPNRSFTTLSKAFLLSVLVTCQSTYADTLSVTDGQSFDSLQFKQFSLDVAARVQTDSHRIGVRATLRPIFSNHVAPFIETSRSFGDLDDLTPDSTVKFGGTSIGSGFYYLGLPDLYGARSILKVSYIDEENTVDTLISVGGRQASVDYNQRSVFATLLFSPKQPLLDNGLNSYAAVGIGSQRTRRIVFADRQTVDQLAQDDSTVQGYIAAGVVYPYRDMRFYAVAEFQEEASLSIGMRWNRNKQ